MLNIFANKYIVKRMKNVVGHPARGEDFFPRIKEIDKIKRSLLAGNNLQIAAPRRIGKTSILMYFIDTAQNDFIFIYVDVEATKNENDFYKRLYESILKSEALTKATKLIKQFKDSGNTFLKRIKSVNILEGAIELSEGVEINYYDEFSNLLKGIDLGEKKLALLIDEFPYAINNLRYGQDVNAAKNLLKSKRTIRQDPALNKKILFVYTGSISLNATVEQIASSELVNDIDSISVSPLSPKDAKDLIKQLTATDGIKINDDGINYVIEKLKWLIPFHMQLFVKELYDLVDERSEEVSNKQIDNAFDAIVEFRNNNYFEHYSSRLSKLYKDYEYQFAQDVLNTIAENDLISKNEIINIAAKYNLESEFNKVIQGLIYDGYIFLDVDGKLYRFNSTILKMWWKRYVSK
jgi:uncharacterized protein